MIETTKVVILIAVVSLLLPAMLIPPEAIWSVLKKWGKAAWAYFVGPNGYLVIVILFTPSLSATWTPDKPIFDCSNSSTSFCFSSSA